MNKTKFLSCLLAFTLLSMTACGKSSDEKPELSVKVTQSTIGKIESEPEDVVDCDVDIALNISDKAEFNKITVLN